MPKYDYFCAANGRTVELSHKIGERLATWGELRARIDISGDGTPDDAPVHRLITASAIVSSGNLGSTERPCDYGSPCGGCMCSDG